MNIKKGVMVITLSLLVIFSIGVVSVYGFELVELEQTVQIEGVVSTTEIIEDPFNFDFTTGGDNGEIDYGNYATDISDDGYVVMVWSRETDTSSGSVLYRLYDPEGTAIIDGDDAAACSGGKQKQPDVAFGSNGDFAIVWATNSVDAGGTSGNDNGCASMYGKIYETKGGKVNADYDIAMRFFHSDGTPYEDDEISPGSGSGVSAGGEFLVNNHKVDSDLVHPENDNGLYSKFANSWAGLRDDTRPSIAIHGDTVAVAWQAEGKAYDYEDKDDNWGVYAKLITWAPDDADNMGKSKDISWKDFKGDASSGSSEHDCESGGITCLGATGEEFPLFTSTNGDLSQVDIDIGYAYGISSPVLAATWNKKHDDGNYKAYVRLFDAGDGEPYGGSVNIYGQGESTSSSKPYRPRIGISKNSESGAIIVIWDRSTRSTLTRAAYWYGNGKLENIGQENIQYNSGYCHYTGEVIFPNSGDNYAILYTTSNDGSSDCPTYLEDSAGSRSLRVIYGAASSFNPSEGEGYTVTSTTYDAPYFAGAATKDLVLTFFGIADNTLRVRGYDWEGEIYEIVTGYEATYTEFEEEVEEDTSSGEDMLPTLETDTETEEETVAEEDETPICKDAWDNDGDGMIDFGGCDYDGDGYLDITCEDYEADDAEACYIACSEDTSYVSETSKFYKTDPGCSTDAYLEYNRCSDGIDNDGDGLTDKHGGCDINDDYIIDYHCGCDLDGSGDIDSAEEFGYLYDECTEYTYGCKVAPMYGELTYTIDYEMSCEELGTTLGLVDEGRWYAKDLECAASGDDSERDDGMQTFGEDESSVSFAPAYGAPAAGWTIGTLFSFLLGI